ncbi:3-keto-disaccharide hydrolase [Sediminibacterium ginsengisoli]|uniref:3-keto-alpha-glucoside-1,2-lyase/3-keto-2-hydroxy-glucal hydratase domain-containing protein n=1 Tax=Sediminibacterium ginsengisoli TaxID=413434 RepID=A0A1T4MGH4_9BACT|nr:DUF1080 domain-containing protein [Sediminibacterium ginsengisoli]SJZ65961.1 protein of unknown function [Sediminibacterium ginsengisoli]
MKLVCFSIAMFCFAAAKAQNVDSLVKEAAKTEVWTPVPAVVTPGKTSSDAPSDAIILYNGSNADAWKTKKGTAPGIVKQADGSFIIEKGTGDIITKQAFGNCQLHVEWRSPAEIAGSSQTRGNSGIFLMGRYELQVLDSYENPTYVNGQAGSIYKQYIPLVNACRKPGEWQSYDIIFTAPKFDANGKLISPAYITVLQNGVLIQNHVAIKGSSEWIGAPSYTAHAPKESLVIQDHGKDGGIAAGFRNIWIREL